MKNGSDGQFITCPYCGEEFWTGRNDKTFCSDTHRKLHSKAKKQETEERNYSDRQPRAAPTKDPSVRFDELRPRGKKCEVCGRIGSKLLGITVSEHHIIPRRIGGKADPDNLVDLCNPCHDWAELFADYAKCREEFFHCVRVSYPWPEEMKRPTYDDNKVHCRLHGDWRVWVYGGVVSPRWKCTCKKPESASTAEQSTGPKPGSKSSARRDADGELGTATGK